VAGAAAAGLLIGLAAGAALNLHPDGPTALRDVATPQKAPTAARSAVDVTADDFFMMEADLAVGSRGVPSLAAIEAATPSGRDFQ
jgi:hypothetical protein